jgi:hypothetical protein
MGAEDESLEDVAWLRLIGDDGRRYTLDEVAAELGIEIGDES